MHTFGWIVTAFVSLLMAAVLELNKNTWVGWVLFALALAGMIILGLKSGAWKGWVKALSILGYLAVCAATDAEADTNWAKIYGALFFNYSHYCLNRLEQRSSIDSWEYLFTKKNGRLGSWHSGEMVQKKIFPAMFVP